MAAVDPEKGRAYYQDLIDKINAAVDDGVIADDGTVTTALTNLATERDAH